METPDTCNALRTEIANVGDKVKALKANPSLMTGATDGADRGEIIANVTLAYRHLEDARMRLGKAIQAFENRESIYGR